jgi:hypothetical protein
MLQPGNAQLPTPGGTPSQLSDMTVTRRDGLPADATVGMVRS